MPAYQKVSARATDDPAVESSPGIERQPTPRRRSRPPTFRRTNPLIHQAARPPATRVATRTRHFTGGSCPRRRSSTHPPIRSASSLIAERESRSAAHKRRFSSRIAGSSSKRRVEVPVRLTVAPDELAAEVLCGRLRANGIKCGYRKTDPAAAISGYGGGFAMAGPTEVLVDEQDLEKARKLLP
jgi:Putative prokaryotic signal transducing protein